MSENADLRPDVKELFISMPIDSKHDANYTAAQPLVHMTPIKKVLAENNIASIIIARYSIHCNPG